MRNRQCMAFIAVAMLAVTPARAVEPAQSCDITVNGDAEAMLKQVSASVRERQKLDILVVGTGSSTLGGTGGAMIAYPARLDTALRERLPNVAVKVTTEILPKKTAEESVPLMGALLARYEPDLVIWQTGTADGLRAVDPDDFQTALREGIALVQKANTDVVLINAQYSPRTETMIAMAAYLDGMRRAAQEAEIVLFDRFSAMKAWSEAGAFDLFGATHTMDVAKQVHDCVGRALALEIVEAAGLSQRPSAQR